MQHPTLQFLVPLFLLRRHLKIMLSMCAGPTEQNVFPTLLEEWTHTNFFLELHVPRYLTQLSVLQNYGC